MRVAIYTLGCKVNQYETQAMESALLSRGHALVPFHDAADAYIVNTCTVTAASDKKARQAIRRARRQGSGAVVAVCGCYAQHMPHEMQKLGVDLVAGSGDRMGFLDRLEETCRNRTFSMAVDRAQDRCGFEFLPAGTRQGRTRALLKIEDGCDNHCAYCIIPSVRGPVRSLAPAQAVREARRLVDEGFRELVVTGIEISAYGRDLDPAVSLTDLLERISGAAPGLRIRLSSLEPGAITEEFCRRAASWPNLCPHFHLSLQSGCDATLARMNRNYRTGQYAQALARLRRHFDRPAITTDLIVGFPGETQAEFETTLSFLQTCAFAAMHIFPYSRRPGTPAAQMEGQLTAAIKQARAQQVTAAARQMERQYLSQWVGETLPVLFEETKDGQSIGHASNYARVTVPGDHLKHAVCPVSITGLTADGLSGVLQPQGEQPPPSA